MFDTGYSILDTRYSILDKKMTESRRQRTEVFEFGIRKVEVKMNLRA